MDQDELRGLFERVLEGSLSIAEAIDAVGARARPERAELGFARVDLGRLERQGMSEVVFGQSKSAEEIVAIARVLADAKQNVLVTRVDRDKADRVRALAPEFEYREVARVLRRDLRPIPRRRVEPIALVCAGTSDRAVAEEAAETLDVAGFSVDRIYDVGVAGIHRLLAELGRIERAPAVLVFAGMEGALPSVLGGLVRTPVIAVPTSIGYGAALGGWTALLGMLTSCASGVTVTNIDNGFGAALAVVRLFAAERTSEGDVT